MPLCRPLVKRITHFNQTVIMNRGNIKDMHTIILHRTSIQSSNILKIKRINHFLVLIQSAVGFVFPHVCITSCLGIEFVCCDMKVEIRVCQHAGISPLFSLHTNGGLGSETHILFLPIRKREPSYSLWWILTQCLHL